MFHFWRLYWWLRYGSWRPFRDKCEICKGAKGGVPGNENVIDGIIVCDYCHSAMDGEMGNEWYDRFVEVFKRKYGREPNPLETAHNIPNGMSDSDTMHTMIAAMERSARLQ